MQDEKRKILEMVGEGKISQEDALRLLDALGEDGADPVGEVFQSTMEDLRGGQESGGQQEPGAAPAQEGIWEEMGEAAREVGQVLSQTAAATVDVISEGVQWAKGAVQKIPGMSVWWGDGQPEDGRQPYPCQRAGVPAQRLQPLEKDLDPCRAGKRQPVVTGQLLQRLVSCFLGRLLHLSGLLAVPGNGRRIEKDNFYGDALVRQLDAPDHRGDVCPRPDPGPPFWQRGRRPPGLGQFGVQGMGCQIVLMYLGGGASPDKKPRVIQG